jgi:hypothetical protein
MEEAGDAFAPPLQDPAPSAAPTAEDLREAKRRADEAAKVLEDSTPEM